MRGRQKIALAGLLICIAAGLISMINVIGGEARFVHVLAIFFTGFGGGASLVAFIKKTSR